MHEGMLREPVIAIRRFEAIALSHRSTGPPSCRENVRKLRICQAEPVRPSAANGPERSEGAQGKLREASRYFVEDTKLNIRERNRGCFMRLILASRSPRRQELLAGAGFEFEVRPSQVEEIRRSGETVAQCASRVAREKALDVARSTSPECLVLGADTMVAAGEEVLGKPTGPEDAARMLRLLSGTTHQVITGVCLVLSPDRVIALKHETTSVTFRTLDEQEILDYLRSGEPFDKAGAYGIQGRASRFVTRIEGCYFNVVGLPVALVYDLLKPFTR